MIILLHKLSDERHALEIARPDGRRERIECETKSTLLHDLLHFAVEREAGLGGGFWGNLARGKTLADMNDRSGAAMRDVAGEMAAIEQIVGALHGATKGRPPAELIAGMRRYAAALGTTLPAWLTEPLLVRVEERLRQLVGHWRATPFGGTMQLDWP